tara:strand:- start:160 stop:1092 length:933 start_codon:yes stop_codon:yes gene_type:complete
MDRKKEHITEFEGLKVDYEGYQNFLSKFKKLINWFLHKFGIEIKRYSSINDYTSEFYSYHTNIDLINRRVKKINTAFNPFNNIIFKKSIDERIKNIHQYFELIKSSPVKIDGGGLGILNGLKLFIATKEINPDYIIESGVWRGFSSFIFNAASHDNTKIFSFDINLNKLVYKESEKITFYEEDWFRKISRMNISKDRTLLFFDDHFPHSKRLIEAKKLGFKNIIFDDNYPIDQIFIDGWPPVPTIDMCMDDMCLKITNLTWLKNNNKYHGTWNSEELKYCRSLIKRKIDFPSLYKECGYQPGSKMTYVEI